LVECAGKVIDGLKETKTTKNTSTPIK
jgi:hypothetical protein